MNTKTIPFTLERWKQGDCEVWTAGGEAVNQLTHFNVSLKMSLYGEVAGIVCSWYEGGKASVLGSGKDDLVLRVKSKLRPWKSEEVPVGALIRTKSSHQSYIRHMIVGLNHDGAILAGQSFEAGLKFALENCEHSIDLGKTWHSCGVEE